MKCIYLDHNATAPLDPAVAEAMAECFAAGYANPASQHEPGRRARRRLEEAREDIAGMLGANTEGMDADRFVFTSGGTEANNLALFGLTDPAVGRLIVSAIEHPSVVAPAEYLQKQGWDLSRISALPSGLIDVDSLAALLSDREAGQAVVSVMLGNNDTGVLQPLDRIAVMCRQANAVLHTDAVQVAGKLPVSFASLGVDALTVSAHKFCGPRGIGGLLVRHGVDLHPHLHGGFQQAGQRPGTEDVGLAVGMQVALRLWHEQQEARTKNLAALREQFEGRLKSTDASIVIIGANAPRLPHTSNIAFPGLDRQALVMALDLAGVACSTGSACASGSSEPSPTLLAMGCDKSVTNSTVRFSLGVGTNAAEIDEATDRISRVVNNLRRCEKDAK